MHEGPYASCFNTEIDSINDELKTIKSLLNDFLTTPQTNIDTSESASMKNLAQDEN